MRSHGKQICPLLSCHPDRPSARRSAQSRCFFPAEGKCQRNSRFREQDHSRRERSSSMTTGPKYCGLLFLIAAVCAGSDLTGNWLIATPNGDGTMRRTYLNLKQQGGRITGTI